VARWLIVAAEIELDSREKMKKCVPDRPASGGRPGRKFSDLDRNELYHLKNGYGE
jgi:hypothetical protein